MAFSPIVGWTFSVVAPRTPNIAAAKKDCHARRFYNKNFTSAGDLLGALSFWVVAQFPLSSMEDFLKAIVPDSGWVEDEDFDPLANTRRAMKDYGADFNSLITGWWDKWPTP